MRKIKNLAPDLGVVILTGHSSEGVAIEALKGHADEYIEKSGDLAGMRTLIDELLESKTRRRTIEGRGLDGKIQRVKQFLERNVHKKVSLQDAAQAVNLSPKYLSRVFRQRTGASFSRYRVDVKVTKAKELLRKTAYTAGEIKDKLGYENLESFIQIFKKATGLAPIAYRKAAARKRENRK